MTFEDTSSRRLKQVRRWDADPNDLLSLRDLVAVSQAVVIAMILPMFGCRQHPVQTRNEGKMVGDGGAQDRGPPTEAAAYWTDGGLIIRKPLTSVDYERHEINSTVLVVGGGADEALRKLYKKTSDPDSGVDGFINLAGPNEPSYTYLPLTYGDIRGYKPTFHLYGVTSDQRLAPVARDIADQVAGIIVVHVDPSDTSNIMVVARALIAKKRQVPTAVIGNDELSGAWANTTGVMPIFAAVPSEDAFSLALKAVSKEILSSLKNNSQPASAPPSAAGPAKPFWKFW